MSSDPIEAMFGFLRRSAGFSDMLDVKTTGCGLEKMLKTGIVAASSNSTVQCSSTFSSRQLLPLQQPLHMTPGAFDKALNMAAQGLKGTQPFSETVFLQSGRRQRGHDWRVHREGCE
ncbi:hypothetical protein MTO96_022433 [Rhipicephalus appendiculatus]